MIYLASPYSHKNNSVMEERYFAAMDCTAWLLGRREWVYSPIAHCHELAKVHELPKDFNLWKEYNTHMLEKADELYVLEIEGWKDSIGIAEEMSLARSGGIVISAIRRNGSGYDVKEFV